MTALQLKRHKSFLGVSVDPEVFEKIEEKRGDVSRSRYVQQALRWFLEKEKETSDQKKW